MNIRLVIILTIVAVGTVLSAMYFYYIRRIELRKYSQMLSFICFVVGLWCGACSNQTNHADRKGGAGMGDSQGLPLSEETQSVSSYYPPGQVESTDDPLGMSVASIISEDPEKNYLIVEQAVDAWLYFNISDFKSFEPLIRSTTYDGERNVYLHNLRYRSMNPEGGIVTTEAEYEVDLNSPGANGNPFHVTPL